MKHFLLFLVLITLLIPAYSVSAASIDYTIAPFIIDHSLEKRDLLSEKITITNNDNKVIRLYATVNEIQVDDGGAIEEFVPPIAADNSNTVTSWIEISRGRIQIQPGETKEVPMTIRVNPNAASGEYHAFVGFGTGSNRDQAQAQVMKGEAKGVIVRIGLDEEVDEFLRLERFNIDRFITSSETEGIHYTLQNPSAVPVTPKGEMIFYDSRGREVSSTKVNQDNITLAPGETITINQAVPESDSFGRHKAFLSVEYGENLTASVHDTQFFYHVPLKQLIILFFSILAAALVVTVLVYRRNLFRDEGYDDESGDDVRVFVREGVTTNDADHDVNLKK